MCSPGCFSLLRGSAVLEDHVLAMYSTKSNEANEYVQYDQGIVLASTLKPNVAILKTLLF